MAPAALDRHPCLVRVSGLRLRLFACLLIALVAVLTLTSATALGAKHDPPTCTWGASSVHAEIVDGNVVASEPATSGCIQ
jgi:hypothetical protein